MASPDPNTPVVDTNAIDPGILDQVKQIDSLGDAMVTLNKLTSGATDYFNKFETQLSNAGVSIDNLGTSTANTATKIAAITTIAMGASDAFKNMGDVDTSGMNLMSKQYTDLINIMAGGKNGISEMTGLLASFGRAITPDIIAGGVGAVADFAKNAMGNIVAAADNSIKLQTALIQLSAKTGDLGPVLNAAGDDLENMNAILASQENIIAQNIKTTGLSREQIESYYLSLGKVPGALSATIKQSKEADDVTSMLTATTRIAASTGMSHKEIVDSLSNSYNKYSTTGEQALTFVARMSEISQNYNIQLSDVQKALTDSANAFASYGAAGENAGRMLEGTANIMNNYVDALKQSGLSGTQATNVISEMTGQLSKLDIAQKSYLSSQTGGPGGLMGAFQIEKMMKEGKVDDVMEKVRETLMKQFGKIISLDEAAGSQQAAAQLTKQMMMIKQGPLGQFARSDQDALRILEAFDKRVSGAASIRDLSSTIVQDKMSLGMKFQETTATEAGRIRGLMEAARSQSNAPILGTLQQATGARVGTNQFVGAESQDEKQGRLRRQQAMIDASEKSGEASYSWGKVKSGENTAEDRTMEHMGGNLRESKSILGDLSQTVRGFVSTLIGVAKDESQQGVKVEMTDKGVDNKVKEQEQQQSRPKPPPEPNTSTAPTSQSQPSQLQPQTPNASPVNTQQQQQSQPVGFTWFGQQAEKPAIQPDYKNIMVQAIKTDEKRETNPAKVVASAVPETKPAIDATNKQKQTNEYGNQTQANNQSVDVKVHNTLDVICKHCFAEMSKENHQERISSQGTTPKLPPTV